MAFHNTAAHIADPKVAPKAKRRDVRGLVRDVGPAATVVSEAAPEFNAQGVRSIAGGEAWGLSRRP